MSLLFSGAITASLVVLAALVATALLRSRSAAVRHWILSAAIICAAAAPALARVAPSWHVPWSAAGSTGQTLAPSEIITAVNPQPDAGSNPARARATGLPMFTPALFARLWAAGFALSLLMLAAGIARLRSLAAPATPVVTGPWADQAGDVSRAYGLTRTVRLLQSEHPAMLVTWGWLRPIVLLPRSAEAWPADRVRVVLCHELAHIRRGDWAIQMVAELLRSVYWFNPLMWLACRRLRQESEQACDDAVLSLGVDGASYATLLLDLARAFTPHSPTWFPSPPAPAIARPSSLEGRIVAMLNARINRSPIGRPAAVAVSAAVLAVTIVLAGLSVAAQTPFGSLSGTVVDSMGRAIPDTTLTLSNAQSRAKYEVHSDQSGRYEFVGLTAGDYALQVVETGFMILRDTFTSSGQDARRNITLAIGTIEETITVTDSDVQPEITPPVDLAVRLRYSAKADPCNVSPAGGCIRPPLMLRRVNPFYPTSLGASGIEGVVTLEGAIGTDGLVSGLRAAKPAQPDLIAAAVQAVSRWEYAPTHLDGFPIMTQMQVTVRFVHQK